ncbi:hypothetical protein GCM10023225_09010 [Kineococcus glutinatus]|uniref:Uncharacterized protein n=1 Tax=Kineococcus glutinatus TaxID=1070872 RepID=A0ABP9HE93_9ACTN
MLRELAWAWADGDFDKQAFVDALTIIPIGTRVGPWAVRLLATRNHELCQRLAILSDSDKDFDEAPAEPAWVADHDPEVVRVFFSHPTLEPAVTPGNEALVQAALDAINLEVEGPITAQRVRDAFRSARVATKERPALAAGPGARKKGEFALAFAEQLISARDSGRSVNVPPHVEALLNFLRPDFTPSGIDDQSAPSGTSDTEAAAMSGVFDVTGTP